MWSQELHGFAGLGQRVRQRFMERGVFKYILLDMLKDKPSHGYELIRSLEERLGGAYSPSPGAVYPTLQMLEDQGYVRSHQEDDRKVYEITDEGRKFLEKNHLIVEKINDRMKKHSSADNWEQVVPLVLEMRELVSVLHRGPESGWTSPEQTKRICEVLEKARKDIATILAE